jgi:hypothetical protein
MVDSDSLEHVRIERRPYQMLLHGGKFKGDVNIMSAATPWSLFLSDFYKIGKWTSLMSPVNLQELGSRCAKIGFHFLTAHSWREAFRVTLESGLVLNCAEIGLVLSYAFPLALRFQFRSDSNG